MIAIAYPWLFWPLVVIGTLAFIALLAWAGGAFDGSFSDVVKEALIIFGILIIAIIFIAGLTWSICGSWGVCK